jgi:hypothetical protein
VKGAFRLLMDCQALIISFLPSINSNKDYLHWI